MLVAKMPVGQLPLPPAASMKLCEDHLPAHEPLPRFFQVRAEARGEVGRRELELAYDRIHEAYDEFWLKEAAGPIHDLVERIPFTNKKCVFEAGCGTGYATALIARRLAKSGRITAVDLSDNMLEEARRRVDAQGIDNVRFVQGDALEVLKMEEHVDLVFSSWVLGYIPLYPFFTSVRHALRESGHLAFVVHKENSPREPLEIFWDLIAEVPSVLQKRVAFDFPRDPDHVRMELLASGYQIECLWEGEIRFHYNTPEEILEHLLKSGAGTAFYDAIEPSGRGFLECQFLKTLSERRKSGGRYEVVHEYISCIAVRP
jgi:SAM-dependent methyltransferase